MTRGAVKESAHKCRALIDRARYLKWEGVDLARLTLRAEEQVRAKAATDQATGKVHRVVSPFQVTQEPRGRVGKKTHRL